MFIEPRYFSLKLKRSTATWLSSSCETDLLETWFYKPLAPNGANNATNRVKLDRIVARL